MSTNIQSPNTLKLTEQADQARVNGELLRPNQASIKFFHEQADQARVNGELGVALVWINTAAILETSGQRNDSASPLHAILLGLIFDGATYCEDLALKCGNVFEKHLGWLESMHEASALLLSRLPADCNEAATVALVSGHLATLQKQFAPKSQTLRLPTTTVQVNHFVNVMHEIREQAAKLAPEGTCVARTTASRLLTLNHLAGNANAQMLSFPLRCLSDWDAAHFYVNVAIRFVDEMPEGAVELVGQEKEVQDLRAALAAAQTALAAKDYHGSRRYLSEARALVNSIGGFARSH